MEKFIIDTDPGIDDMMAILFLLRQKNIDIKLISLVDGNVALEKVKTNSKKILKIAGKTLPLYCGSSTPIVKTFPNIDSYHYSDGLGDIEEIQKYNADDINIEKENSVLKIIETVKNHKNDINLICLGPLTNIATAFMLEPELPNWIKNIYMMGGSYLSLGNTIAASEFNFLYDFLAANIVLRNFKRIIITPWEPTVHAGLSIKSETMSNVDLALTSKNIDRNQTMFKFVNLIVDKYTTEKGDTCFCDLYSVIPAFNKRCVKKFAMYRFDVVIDAFDARGMSAVKQKIPIEKDFETFVANELKDKRFDDFHLVIEEFYDKIVLEEYEQIFIKHN